MAAGVARIVQRGPDAFAATNVDLRGNVRVRSVLPQVCASIRVIWRRDS